MHAVLTCRVGANTVYKSVKNRRLSSRRRSWTLYLTCFLFLLGTQRATSARHARLWYFIPQRRSLNRPHIYCFLSVSINTVSLNLPLIEKVNTALFLKYEFGWKCTFLPRREAAMQTCSLSVTTVSTLLNASNICSVTKFVASQSVLRQNPTLPTDACASHILLLWLNVEGHIVW